MSKYTPSEREVAVAWGEYRDRMDACNALVRDEDDDPRAEFDAFIARVRRDAAREALDGLAGHTERMAQQDHERRMYLSADREQHVARRALRYRDTHYSDQEDDR